MPLPTEIAMEPKFIVNNRNIPQMLTDAYGYYTRKLRYGICGVFALIILVMGLMGRLPRVIESIAVFAALCIPTAWCIPYLIVGAAMRNVKKANNGVVPESLVTVEEEVIRVQEGEAEIRVSYEDITLAKRLRHGYLLAATPASVMLDLKGFAKGTPEEFAVFLQEKRPDLKIH